MTVIKRLSPHLVNQIAAGEVIERPAAVIKELIENAIDAKATMIEVAIRHGGKSYIKIKDNGIGMAKDDLGLAFERHATSKLADDDLFNIHTYGFRGEALPSIASISRVEVMTVHDAVVSSLSLEAGKEAQFHGNEQYGRGIHQGTSIEIFDLFFATPARLKFLKSDTYETMQSVSVFKRMALANPQVGFKLMVEDAVRLNLPKHDCIKTRIAALWDKTEFGDLRFFDYAQDDLQLSGCISVPTCHRAQNDAQYFFVNNRFVKDKIFAHALKLAYGDRIPPRRFPLACVFLTLPYDSVDVNVHPCKTEVRFLDESLVRRHLATAINGALSFGGALQTTQRLVSGLASIAQMCHPREETSPPCHPREGGDPYFAGTSLDSRFRGNDKEVGTLMDARLHGHDKQLCHPRESGDSLPNPAHLPDLYLGQAKTQIFKTYIISTTADKTFIVDQHAAHERITYEKYKTQKGSFLQQKLVVPVTISLTPEQKKILQEFKASYQGIGFDFTLQDDALLLVSVPSLIPPSLYAQVVQDTLDHLVHYESAQNVDAVIDSILATMACYNSIRKGQVLTVMEMDALLRAMEKTPNIAQCNHGRPTYIELQRNQLDRLFQRI